MSAPDAARARIALITHPPEGAQAFARTLVEHRVAACVNLVPVQSVYRWEGGVEDDSEVLLIAKTVVDRVPDLERALSADHPYDVPELVVFEPDHVEAEYLAWLLDSSRTTPGRPSNP